MDRGDVFTLGLGAALAAVVIAAFARWGPDSGFTGTPRALYRELCAMGLPPVVAGPLTVLMWLGA